jgi:surface carbohydrate biosynthesis protein
MENKLTGIYIVDHPDRDLSSYIWWTLYNMVDPGNVYLIPMNEMSEFTIIRLKPNYIVWNYARPNNEKLINFAKKFGVINIIHDTEGIPYDLSKYFSSASNYLIKNIDIILAWGEIQTYTLREKLTSINPGLIIVNFGSLRYEYIKSLPKVDIENNFGVFLWNLNFPSMSPKYK